MHELWLIVGIPALASLLTWVTHLPLRRRGERISGLGVAFVAARCWAASLPIILYRMRGRSRRRTPRLPVREAGRDQDGAPGGIRTNATSC